MCYKCVKKCVTKFHVNKTQQKLAFWNFYILPIYKTGVIAIPGEIKCFKEAHDLFGKKSWRELFAPAISLARNGWTIYNHTHGAMDDKKNFMENARTPFFRTDPPVYHKFENMIIFRSGNVYSLCTPENQDDAKIIHFSFFRQKGQN